ncbi:hypothetical protein 6991_0013 [Klebsiella phage 6991]|uniref:hypothetical protein n=1 Tax=Klebsiella phage 6991 TaxID=2912296 RepID=UPI00218500FA|nr:hypothetical protein PRB93_gp13 [Klebsiella phage 6991]URY99547.1 hypothetical protein 6991_0013 [Klebsiella phage 6991]
MKTIDFLVKELPKLGGWPDGAIGAGFLCGEGTLYFWDDNDDCPSKWRVETEVEVEDSESEISREQYEAAMAAKNDGWIEWGGGECPVPCGTAVDVKHRCGAVSENQQAWPKHHKESDVVVNPFSNAGQAFWRHENSVVDIIAYRLHKPTKSEQVRADAWNAYAGITEADDEADLNECIGQDAAPVWNGAGLPPAGCECEYQYKVHGSEWCPLECVAVDGKAVFGWSNNTPVALRSNTHNFRPLRSEVDKKREEAIMSLAKSGGAAPFKYGEKLSDGQLLGSMWYELYDAIAAGKVRGVKLED